MVVDAERSNPNGITLSLDEAFLFVTDGQGLLALPGQRRRQHRHRDAHRAERGVERRRHGHRLLREPLRHVPEPVVLVNPTGTGTSLGIITVNAQSATNVAFGGANHQTLYVSGLGNGMGGGATMGLFRADMPLPGMPF